MITKPKPQKVCGFHAMCESGLWVVNNNIFLGPQRSYRLALFTENYSDHLLFDLLMTVHLAANAVFRLSVFQAISSIMIRAITEITENHSQKSSGNGKVRKSRTKKRYEAIVR